MAKKFMPPDEVEEFALEFLRAHHPENSIPVPIEEIIELRLKIDIVPTPGMVTETGVDATTSHDFTQINIDQQQYQSVPNRARFTLAHEVGHLVLHKSFVESHTFSSVAEWKKFVEEDLNRDPMETQANMFAAFLLMPTEHIAREFAQEKNTLLKNPNYKAEKIPGDDILAPYLARPLAKRFEVSEEAMTHRLKTWIKAR